MPASPLLPLARTAGGQWLIAALVAITLWRVGIAWLLPVTQDEAYYFDWARALAWGYFDHPPGVAALGLGTLLAPGSALAARLGNLIAATLTLLALLAFYRRCGLDAARDRFIAITLAVTPLPTLAGGALTTPDTVLALAWVLALHEALAALQGARARWISAGAAVGLGLLAKYTMVLIGPVLLWAILRGDPRALRSPWPYVGALTAFLVFLPHVLWNAEQDWLTMRFQFGHGFSVETGALVGTDLPEPVDQSAEATDQGGAETAPRWGGVARYLGTQIALFGLLVIPLAAGSLGSGVRREIRSALTLRLDPRARPLLYAAAAFPLVFFGVVAWLSEVEPNWPVAYLFAAAPLFAVVARPWWRWILVAAGANLVLVSLYAIHGATGALPLPPSQERILRETHGYRELAALASKLDAPVFADRYQTTAMLRFYAPGLAAGQWPGLTRPSEYLRDRILAPDPPSLEDIRRAGGFWLIARATPPALPGFRLQSTLTLYDCRENGLVEAPEAPCKRPLHRWRLHRYRTDR